MYIGGPVNKAIFQIIVSMIPCWELFSYSHVGVECIKIDTIKNCCFSLFPAQVHADSLYRVNGIMNKRFTEVVSGKSRQISRPNNTDDSATVNCISWSDAIKWKSKVYEKIIEELSTLELFIRTCLVVLAINIFTLTYLYIKRLNKGDNWHNLDDCW